MIELKLKTGAGSLLFDFLVFTPAAFWKIDAFRAATGETVTPDLDVDLTPDDLIGRTGDVRVSVEEYNGRKRNKVAAWLAAGTQGKGGGHVTGNPF
jgi:membrane protein implicated in regulation of membrane protease activity